MVEKKRRTRVLVVILVLIVIVALVVNSQRTLPNDMISSSSSEPSHVALGASSSEGYFTTYCVSEYGVLYMRDNLMRYFDFASSRSFVLCGRPNCPHISSICNAWYTRKGDIEGLAQYGDRIYAFKKNSIRNSYDLVCMDLRGSVERVVFSLGIGSYKAGIWHVDSIDSMVYYAGGHAWIKASYTKAGNGSNEEDIRAECLIGIDLYDGSRIDLAGIPLEKGYMYDIRQVTEDSIVYNSRWDDPQMLSEQEFNEAYERGEYPEVDEMEPDPNGFPGYPYYYYMRWHNRNSAAIYQISIFDIPTGRREVFAEGEYFKDFEALGDYAGTESVYIIIGYYNGKIIYEMPYNRSGWRNGSRIYSYDARTGERELLVNMESGGSIFANSLNSVTDDGLLLVWQETGDMQTDEMEKASGMIYSYNLETGESVDLFADTRIISFRICGETHGCFLGSFADDYRNIDTAPPLYMLAKDDYYKGNFRAVAQIKL
ncbi:MAG: hypothetical protein FWH40_08340 [Coriobacteriia bacterium]|nr:hypothetical protein [Coriobacteriia bacterium]